VSRSVVCAAVGMLACARAQAPAPPPFDGARALEHVRALVSIGPRVAGSPGAQQAREYITNQLTALGLQVQEQPFDAATPIGRVKMVNLRATLPGPNEGEPASPKRPTGAKPRRLIVAGHYDTKLFQKFRFVGANDGGSSAAFLIELARVLKDRKNPLAIELLFLDGEEAVVTWTDEDSVYGSRYYTDAARKDGTLREIAAMILVDMIGDRDLRIQRDPNSTPWLTDIIWSTARRLTRREFVDDELAIEDDHLPFIKAGVPAVDIIDLDYPAWHTEDDTIDKVSAESLKAVGDVLLAALPEIEARLR
jgi:glutaminyl-peptide cyclotransferase